MNANPWTTWLRRNGALVAVVLLALLIRLPFLAVDFGRVPDLGIFRQWGGWVAAEGLANIYTHPEANYPPLANAWFGAATVVAEQVTTDEATRETLVNTLIKLGAALADIGTGLVIALAFRTRRALVLAAYVLNPAVWYASMYWGQIDSVYAFFVILAAGLLAGGRIVSGWLSFALAMLTKTLAVSFAPVLVVGTWLKGGVKGLAVGAGTAAVVGLLALSPWLAQGDVLSPVQSAFRVSNRTPRIDMSGYNAWYLALGGEVHNVSSQERPLGLPLAYFHWSVVLLAAVNLLILYWMWRAASPPIALAGAAAAMAFFLFAPEVHERYLFPALGLTLLAAATRVRLGWVFALLSVTFLFNLVTIVPFTLLLGSNLVAPQEVTTVVAALKMIALITAALNVGALGALLYELWRAPRRGRQLHRETS